MSFASGGVAGGSQGGRPSFGGSTGGRTTKVCLPPATQCGTECVDTSTSLRHCGACSSPCPSGCVNGACRSSGCLPNETYCSNFARCIDLQTNAFACGDCNNACPNGEACLNGACAPGTCLFGLTQCVGSDNVSRCVNVSTDSSNCGICNQVCNYPESCQSGKCLPPTCSPGQTYCASLGCVDTSSDLANCGACGKSCQGGSIFDYTAYVCTSGTCGCSTVSNACSSGCASDFWYCPPSGFQGSATDLCNQSARNAYERCACKSCLAQTQACSGSLACINAMDCSLRNLCVGCSPPFSSCGDQSGAVDPLADKLVTCMNSLCSAP